LSRKHIIEGLDASLKRLQLQYVDVIFAHRPDTETPIEETVRAFNHVIDQGKAFYWGTSEWTAQQIQQAQAVADKLGLIGPTCEQPQYSLLHRARVEKEYAALYKEIGLGTTVWSPLAFGVLTGKYKSADLAAAPEDSRLKKIGPFASMILSMIEVGSFEKCIQMTDSLKAIADRLGCTQAQLALAWVIKNPNVSTAMTGHTSVEQVHDSYGALAVVPKLTPEILKEIDDLLGNKPKPAVDPRKT